jgi:hypothetical protein
MAFVDRLRRLASLLGIVGLSLGSLVVSACGGSTGQDGQADSTDDSVDVAGDADAAVDPVTEPEEDVAEDPDTDLWDVICE